jgi:WhiB family redox-sensing transcriptional regulator
MMIWGDMRMTTTYQDYEIELDEWREAAACSDRTDVDFFPVGDDIGDIARAKAVCAGCPVADECLAFAIQTNQPEGIWGGTTAQERVKLRRRWMQDLREAS